MTCKINASHEVDDYGCIDCFYDEANRIILDEVEWE